MSTHNIGLYGELTKKIFSIYHQIHTLHVCVLFLVGCTKMLFNWEGASREQVLSDRKSLGL